MNTLPYLSNLARMGYLKLLAKGAGLLSHHPSRRASGDLTLLRRLALRGPAHSPGHSCPPAVLLQPKVSVVPRHPRFSWLHRGRWAHQGPTRERSCGSRPRTSGSRPTWMEWELSGREPGIRTFFSRRRLDSTRALKDEKTTEVPRVSCLAPGEPASIRRIRERQLSRLRKTRNNSRGCLPTGFMIGIKIRIKTAVKKALLQR